MVIKGGGGNSSNLWASTVTPLVVQLLDNVTEPPRNGEQVEHKDEPGTSASLEFMVGSRFWIQRVLVPVVVLVGILGNVVTIVVMTRRRMRSSTNVYLTALAISDLFYLLFLFSLSLAHYGLTGLTADAYWTYWRFGLWFTDATSSTSIWLTVSFTLERYIAVCHPMRGKMLCTESRARKVILLVYALCFLSTASTPFEWQTVRVSVSGSAAAQPQAPFNETLHENFTDVTPVATKVSVVLTELGNLQSYRTLFYWFTSIVFVFLPLLLLVVFNSFLVLAVHRSQRQRRHLTQTERHGHGTGGEGSQQTAQQENKITVTLIAVVVLFLVCQLPTAVTLLYTSLTENAVEGSARDHVLRGLGNIFNFLVAVNAAANFILYCALSDKYRRTFAMTFLPRRCWARRDLLRTTTLMGGHTASCYVGDSDSSNRVSRSPSIWKSSANDGVSTEYLQVPLNGGREAVLKRHQSAYVLRDRQVRTGSRKNSTGSGVPAFTRTKSMLSRVDSNESGGGSKSPHRETSGLLADSSASPSSPQPPQQPPSPSLLCFRLPRRSKKASTRGTGSQEVKITVSDAELDELSSV